MYRVRRINNSASPKDMEICKGLMITVRIEVIFTDYKLKLQDQTNMLVIFFCLQFYRLTKQVLEYVSEI